MCYTKEYFEEQDRKFSMSIKEIESAYQWLVDNKFVVDSHKASWIAQYPKYRDELTWKRDHVWVRLQYHRFFKPEIPKADPEFERLCNKYKDVK